MLALGRALMSAPRLLMLDEPSLGLAPLMVQEILAIVRGLRDDGVSILLVEQNARAALESSDEGYVLETGEVALQRRLARARRATRGCRRPTSAGRPMTIESLPADERTLPAMLRAAPQRHGDRPLRELRRRVVVAPRPAAPRGGARGDLARRRRRRAATGSR